MKFVDEFRDGALARAISDAIAAAADDLEREKFAKPYADFVWLTPPIAAD